MKKTLTKSIKYYLALIIIALCCNCENESIESETLVQKDFKSQLSFADFQNPAFLHNNFQVDWNTFEIHQKDNVDYYEFNVSYDPGATFELEGYASKKSYSLLVNPSDKDNVEFLLVAALPLEDSQTQSPLFLTPLGFQGCSMFTPQKEKH